MPELQYTKSKVVHKGLTQVRISKRLGRNTCIPLMKLYTAAQVHFYDNSLFLFKIHSMPKRLLFIVLFNCILFTLLCCGRTEKQDGSHTPEATEPDTTDVYLQTIRTVDEFSNKLQRVVVSDTGIIRGVDFGTPISQVVSLEEIEEFNRTDNRLSFEIDLDSTEVGDVVYLYNESNKVNGIRIELYLRNDTSLNQLSQEIAEYYSLKYGRPQNLQASKYQWMLPKRGYLTMEVIRKGIDRGIVLEALKQ